MHRLRRWILAAFVCALLIAIGVWLFGTRILTAAGARLVEDDGPASVQAALVLGGDEHCSRIMRAAELARAGYAPTVIVSGPGAFGVHECDLTVHYAVSHGYPASLFRPFPNDFTSTRAEAEGIGKYLQEHKITRILLVTSNYHTRRAARQFRRENPGMAVRVVPAPDRWFTPDGWWKNREGRKTFLLEWTKTVTEWYGS